MKECERICQALKEGVRCVLLRGAAGTGKTTLVRDLLTHIEDLSMPRPGFCIMAPGQVSCESKGRVTTFRIGRIC